MIGMRADGMAKVGMFEWTGKSVWLFGELVLLCSSLCVVFLGLSPLAWPSMSRRKWEEG